MGARERKIRYRKRDIEVFVVEVSVF